MSLQTNGNNSTGVNETTNLPDLSTDGNSICFCFFVKVVATTSDFQTFFEIGDNANPPNSAFEMGTNAANTLFEININGTETTGLPVVLGQWMFMAANCNVGSPSGTFIFYCKPVGGGSLTVFTGSSTGPFTTAVLAIGGEAATTGQIDQGSTACIAGVRVWNNIVLSQMDFELESRSIRAYKNNGLFAEWPLDNELDLVDKSGKSIGLTGTAAQLARGEMPPVSYWAKYNTSKFYSIPPASSLPINFPNDVLFYGIT